MTRPPDWDKQQPVERSLANSLRVLTKQVKRIVKLYSTVDEIVAAISAITLMPQWRAYAYEQAAKMTTLLSVKNAKTWKEAARQSSQGYKIYQTLKAETSQSIKFQQMIQQNASVIKSLPNDVAKHVTQAAATETIKGNRASVVAESIRERAPELSDARINLIARTETAKTQAAITESRAERLGLDWYVWRTSEDQRVRSSHKHMSGVLCQYSSPPSPETLIGEKSVGVYNPGGIWNCRCYAEPVIDVDFLPDSLKVLQGGRIVRMSKKKFQQSSF